MCIYQKRLEQGRFAPLWARDTGGPAVALTLSELALFLEGARGVGRLPLSPPPVVPRAVGARRARATDGRRAAMMDRLQTS